MQKTILYRTCWIADVVVADGNDSEYFTTSVELGCSPDANPVHFALIPHVSNRGGAAVISSDGHRYGVKMVKPNVIYWRCAVRNRLVKCPAVVIQRGRTFVRGGQEHCHAPVITSPKRLFSSDDIRHTLGLSSSQPADDVLVDQKSVHDNDNWPAM